MEQQKIIPTKPRVTTSSPDKIHVRWGPPVGNHDELSGYEVWILSQTTNSIMKKIPTNGDSTEVLVDLKDHAATGEVILVKVKAILGCNESEFNVSEPHIFTGHGACGGASPALPKPDTYSSLPNMAQQPSPDFMLMMQNIALYMQNQLAQTARQTSQQSQPSQPAQPSHSGQPSQPARSSHSGQPSQPLQPSQPVQLSHNVQPSQTAQASHSGQPSQPTQPSQPAQPNQPAQHILSWQNQQQYQQMPKPSPPSLQHTCGKLSLIWTYPTVWDAFEICLRKVGEPQWCMMSHHDSAMQHCILNLIPGQKYEVKLRATYKFRISDFSDIVVTEVPYPTQEASITSHHPLVEVEKQKHYDDDSDEYIDNSDDQSAEAAPTKKPTRSQPKPPTQPEMDHVTSSKLSFSWYMDEDSRIDRYEVQYRISDDNEEWQKVFTQNQTREYCLENLQSDTEYEIRLRGMAGDIPGQFTKSTLMKTKMTLAYRVLQGARLIRSGAQSIYRLPLMEHSRNIEYRVRKVEYGTRAKIDVQEKTIMMVGATGAGKSTLINGIANFMFGVHWEDTCRLEIIDPDTEKGQEQLTESQTEYITHYKIHHAAGSPVPCTLNIIDTPGFGDTTGVEKDKFLVDQIRYLFGTEGDEGVQCIDAICFVTIASQPRLTATQRYIIDSVLSVFGEDTKNNICVLITFADGTDPQVLPALKVAQFPFTKYFCFNNSALYNSDASKLTKTFWDMGLKNFENFFSEVALLNTKSLTLSAEVLQERHEIEATLAGLQTRLSERVQSLTNLQDEEKILDNYKAQIEQNKDFTYTTKTATTKRVPDVLSANCKTCNRTCFKVEHTRNGRVLKPIADSMAQLPNVPDCICPICKHDWSMHEEMNFLIDVKQKIVKRTHQELKVKYTNALDKKFEVLNVIDALNRDIAQCEDTVWNLVDIISQKINRLKQIALKENPLSQSDYIDMVVQQERADRSEGYQQRVEALLKVRERAKLFGQAMGGTTHN